MTNNTTAAALTDEQRAAINMAISVLTPLAMDEYGDALRALLTSPRAAVPAPEGWKLVPIVPTRDMLECLWDGLPKGTSFRNCTPLGIYAAMLAASPAAPVDEISAGTEPNPSKESGQSEAVISARGFDAQTVAAPVRLASIRDFGPVPLGEGQDATSTIQQALDCPTRDWPVPEIAAQAVAADGADTDELQGIVEACEELGCPDGMTPRQFISDIWSLLIAWYQASSEGKIAVSDPAYHLVTATAALMGDERAAVSPATSESKCTRCGSSTAQACNELGCFYLESGEGEPATAEPDEVRAHVKWLHSCLRDAGYCIDGGKCHHECGSKGDCFRQAGCVPLTGSHLSDDWTLPVASEPATSDERAARLDDADIDAIAESMPGGLGSFMKQWGWRQFARAVEDEVVLNVARTSQAAAPQANEGEESEDAYVIRRLSETLADVCVTLRGDDPVHPDDPLNKIELVKRLAEVLRMEVELYRAQASAPAEAREPSPTAGMNLGERIKHVGGRENAAGYIEFGSVAAVGALIKQVIRDLPRSAPADAGEAVASIENPLTPYGMLVRALRIVAGTTLMDMATAMRVSPAFLSSLEFGRRPVTYDNAVFASGFFSDKGIVDTLPALAHAAKESQGAQGGKGGEA
ncbi:hypothetical protein [Burkholderia glumae]|uniref:hypothetical protein n=1 Tax=Burkholderia glumae TaxID=337 RepID=UPI0001A4B4D7|nr:hypothetical protein [Burkholderia glumae]ACR29193.1 Hypothetical protein bglu_1g20870 [Burkholderia glumae BGR1]